jgi:hypothetical protein
MNLETLLKHTSFADLTETEQDFVLKTMSGEDYEAARQIVVLSEKLKLSQTYLAPNPALRAQLLTKMQTPTKRISIWNMPYRIAASLLFCIGLFFFLQKNKERNAIKETLVETKVEPKIVELPKVIPPTLSPKATTNIEKNHNKHHAKPIPVAPKEDDNEALAQSFNRKNPNLEWQTEDDEVVLEKSTLHGKPN